MDMTPTYSQGVSNQEYFETDAVALEILLRIKLLVTLYSELYIISILVN